MDYRKSDNYSFHRSIAAYMSAVQQPDPHRNTIPDDRNSIRPAHRMNLLPTHNRQPLGLEQLWEPASPLELE